MKEDKTNDKINHKTNDKTKGKMKRISIIVLLVLLFPIIVLLTKGNTSSSFMSSIMSSISSFFSSSHSNNKRYHITTFKTSSSVFNDTSVDVYFMPINTLPIVDIQVILDAGSARDALANSGLANLCASLLEEGTKDLNANQIAEGFENVGAIYGYNVDKDRAVFALRSLSDDTILNTVCPHFANVIANPVFNEETVQRNKMQTVVSIKQELEDPSVVADRSFYKALYGDHPYANPILGTEQGINSITADMLKAFHQKYYTAKNAVIVVTGNLTQEKAESIANLISKGLPAGTKPDPIEVPKAIDKPVVFEVPFTATQNHIIIGQLGRKTGDKDRFTMQVGNYILGGGPLVSRLFKEIRDKYGLAYSVSSYFVPMKEQGPFMITLETKSDQSKDALEYTRKVLKEFVEQGPTEEEVEIAKKSIMSAFPLRLSTNADLTRIVSEIAFYQLPLDFLEHYLTNVDKVSVSDVKSVFKERIHPEHEVTVVVGNSN